MIYDKLLSRGEEAVMIGEEECGDPCDAELACDDCCAYWDRMRDEGFWVDGMGWTDAAIREMMK